MNNRKSGFYWVKFKTEWQPAQWLMAQGYWLILGIYHPVFERDLQEINETPLTPPAI